MLWVYVCVGGGGGGMCLCVGEEGVSVVFVRWRRLSCGWWEGGRRDLYCLKLVIPLPSSPTPPNKPNKVD